MDLILHDYPTSGINYSICPYMWCNLSVEIWNPHKKKNALMDHYYNDVNISVSWAIARGMKQNGKLS